MSINVDDVDDIRGCSECGATQIEPGYKAALCQKCRGKMVNRPLPAWVMGAGALVLVIWIYAISQFPGALGAGISFHRGRAATRIGNGAVAVQYLEPVAKRYPTSIEAIAALGSAYFAANRFQEAIGTFNQLQGRALPVSVYEEVKQITERIRILTLQMQAAQRRRLQPARPIPTQASPSAPMTNGANPRQMQGRQGAYPQGQYQQGQNPQPQYPQRQYPQGQYPQGQYQQPNGQYPRNPPTQRQYQPPQNAPGQTRQYPQQPAAQGGR